MTRTETDEHGVLFFREGALIDARVNGLQGETAAYEILSWERAVLHIQNRCLQNQKRISTELGAILLEAMRRMDEARDRAHADEPLKLKEEGPPPSTGGSETGPRRLLEKIRTRLYDGGPHGAGVEDVSLDPSWNSFIERFIELGRSLKAGSIQVLYVDRGESLDHIIVPHSENIVVAVDPKRILRDRILQLLTEISAGSEG